MAKYIKTEEGYKAREELGFFTLEVYKIGAGMMYFTIDNITVWVIINEKFRTAYFNEEVSSVNIWASNQCIFPYSVNEVHSGGQIIVRLFSGDSTYRLFYVFDSIEEAETYISSLQTT